MALIDLLGRRWALRILWELRRSPLTFRGLQQACGGPSPSVLNARLAELRETSLVAASDAGYVLTELGRDLLAQASPLTAWAERWVKTLRSPRA